MIANEFIEISRRESIDGQTYTYWDSKESKTTNFKVHPGFIPAVKVENENDGESEIYSY